MYVIIKAIENNNFVYFSMLVSNGIFTDDNLVKAIMFSSAAVATKQKEVLNVLDPEGIYTVKEIVLQDIQQNNN